MFGKKKNKNDENELKEKELEMLEDQPDDEEDPDEDYTDDGDIMTEEDKHQAMLDDMFQQTINYFIESDKKSLSKMQRGDMSKEQFVKEIYKYLSHHDRLSEEDTDVIVEKFKRYIWGYHVLEDVINDPSISDIKVLNVDNVRIKRYGKRENTDIKFNSADDLKNFVKYVAVKNKVNLSNLNAVQTFTDKDSNPGFIMRFTVITEFLTSHGLPYLHIRKIAKDKISMQKLLELDMFDEKVMKYLINKAKNANGILFTGKGASGKTTVMNALLDEIPFDKSGLVIQENEELFSKVHPDLMFEHIITNSGESKVQYTLQDLARTGLLTDLDYFIIGEIKGGEALYLLNAAYTGHRCWASVHGINSTEAMNKLADYVKYSSDYTKEEALQMLSSINTVVFMKDFKVQEISEIERWDDVNKKIIYKTVYRR